MRNHAAQLAIIKQLSRQDVKEIVFNPLYILASFVKDKVSICAWIYLWAFYSFLVSYQEINPK